MNPLFDLWNCGWQNLSAFCVSLYTWYSHRSADPRYRAQSNVVAAWIVREVRRVLNGNLTREMNWELDQFQLFLAHMIHRELIRNNGYYPISNSPLLSPTALLQHAIRAARIHPPEPVFRALPHVRIRIVPGWVKVYGLGTPQSAPTVLYPAEYAREGSF